MVTSKSGKSSQRFLDVDRRKADGMMKLSSTQLGTIPRYPCFNRAQPINKIHMCPRLLEITEYFIYLRKGINYIYIFRCRISSKYEISPICEMGRRTDESIT